jgi:hypothetical protein
MNGEEARQKVVDEVAKERELEQENESYRRGRPRVEGSLAG